MKKIKFIIAAAVVLLAAVVLTAKVSTQAPGKYDEVIAMPDRGSNDAPEESEPEDTVKPTAKKEETDEPVKKKETAVSRPENTAKKGGAAELIKKIAASQEKRKALKTEIEIVSKDAGTGSLQRIIGNVLIKKEDKFRVHYTEPAEQILVSDGEMLWMYVPVLNQVIRQDIDKADMDMQFYIEIESSIEFFAKYSDTKMEEKEDHYILTMIPRDRKRIDYEEITVKTGKDSFFPFYMSIKDENTFIQVNFTDVKTYTDEEISGKKEFDDSNFVLEIPEGADVIEGSELMGY